MKTLNIDAFAAPKRALTVGGTDYPVRNMDVKTFIANIKLAEELEKKGELTPLDQVQMSVNMIKQQIPTLPAEVIEGFSIDQMLMVLQFVRGEMDEKVKESAAASDAAADSKS